MSADLQDLDDPQLGIHHHHVLVVGAQVALPEPQRGGAVGQAVGQTPAHHHLGHHLPHAVDGAQDVVA